MKFPALQIYSLILWNINPIPLLFMDSYRNKTIKQGKKSFYSPTHAAKYNNFLLETCEAKLKTLLVKPPPLSFLLPSLGPADVEGFWSVSTSVYLYILMWSFLSAIMKMPNNFNHKTIEKIYLLYTNWDDRWFSLD